jgi:hypothetical protein
LDGGEGDDLVLAWGGKGAITIGGPGRDWIFNTSYGGQIFGDTIDGLIIAEGEPPRTWAEQDSLCQSQSKKGPSRGVKLVH